MLAENTLIQNRYLVRNLIGRGGMGAVYLAVDTRFNNRYIALKEMLYTNNPKLEAAFEREANLLNKVQHPGLPKVSDFFNENGFQYLAMEYISGDDLGTVLRNNGRPLPVARVLNWADSLLDILEYLHSQHPPIIHRDIKPQNLKLNAEDKVILLDFGLAKDTLTHLSRLTTSDSLVGFTPNYAPLEQIKGDSSTVQTDIFSFAATIYHLLTNIAPASSLVRVQAKIDETPDPLLPAHLINPEVPVKLSEILAQSLTLKREDRAVSATELRRKLKEVALAPVGFQEPKRLFEVPPETSVAISPEVVKTLAFPQMSGLGARPLANSTAANAGYTQPKKSETGKTLALFGVLFFLLVGGIGATYFVGGWISGKMNPAADLQETNSKPDNGAKDSANNNPGSAASLSNVNSSVKAGETNVKIENKTENGMKTMTKPIPTPKVIQPKIQEKKPTVTKPVTTKTQTTQPNKPDILQ